MGLDLAEVKRRPAVLPLGKPKSQRLVEATRSGNELTVREIMPVGFTQLETMF